MFYVPLIAEMDNAESIRYETDVLNGFGVLVSASGVFAKEEMINKMELIGFIE